MLTFSRKPLGIWLVTAFVLGASLLTSLFVSGTAYAVMTGKWIDKSTIRIGTNPDFKGPSTELLNYGPYGQQANFQVFNGTGGVLKVYFGATENLDKATKATYVNTQQGTSSMQDVNLTNTRADVAAASTGGTTTGGTTSTTTTTAADTCKIDGIGWIVCPVASFLGKITDGAYSFVEQFLVFQISSDPFSTDPAINPAYTIWANIRTLANILFIFAFFAIIFSQATSIGLSSYGIKRMLPRLVVAAILVNLSYYLCVLAVDVSNIIGAGLDGLIKSVPLSHLPKDGDGTWEKIVSGVLAGVVGGVALGVALYAALGFVLAFLVSSLLALATALLVLIGRQALLIMLIIMSPLAFVAYILPNTEDLFNKWRKLFTTLLVMYPFIAMLFAGSKVASEVMRITAPGGVTGVIIQIVSLGVLAIPLFALPFILKFSGGILGRLGGMVNDRNKGLIDRARNRGDQSSKARLAERRRRLLGTERDFTGKPKRRALYRGASALGLTSSSRAKSAVDRKNRLANAESNEQRAATNYYAGRASTDEAYANRMSGGSNLPGRLGRTADAGDLARVVGRANEAIIKLNNEEISAHNLSLNRNGATLAAEGIHVSSDGNTLYDRSGAPMTFAQASAAAKIPLDASGRFDAETMEALKYASNNRLSTTSNGAKALASTLAATGNLNTANAQALVDNVQGATPQDKSFITAHINAEASKAGLKHLSYNTVDVNGNFQLGGQFGGVIGDALDSSGNPVSMDIRLKQGVVGRLMQNGASTITKEMYADGTFGPQLARAVDNLEKTSPDTFSAELVKMDPRKIENLVKAKLEAGLVAPYANYSAMSSADKEMAASNVIKRYTAEREAAVERFGLAS